MYMMDIGKETKHMEKESTLIKMEQHTMEIGRMIFNMVEVLNTGTIIQNTKETITEDKNMV